MKMRDKQIGLLAALLATGEAFGAEQGETNLWREAANRLHVSAYADVESAYWARGVIVDKHPFSAQYVGLNADLVPFGYVGGYAWSVSSMSSTGQAATRRNAYNEVDYGAFYGYAWEIADGRDALDANTNPESLKDLTIGGIGAMVRF